MHIILDCDDVLLDWIGGFRMWLNQIHSHIPVPDDGPTSWSMADWLGLPESSVLTLIGAFNSSSAFGHLQPVPDAVRAVAALKGAGHDLTVLTSCLGDPHVGARRRSNLSAHFGDAFHHVVCLPLGESKRNMLKVLRPGVWVEDNFRNACVGWEEGHFPIVMRRSHNRADEAAYRADDHRSSIVTWVDDFAPLVSLYT